MQTAGTDEGSKYPVAVVIIRKISHLSLFFSLPVRRHRTSGKENGNSVNSESRFQIPAIFSLVVFTQDPQQNRIGQWLNATSNGSILQLSFSLNSEVREGSYMISVWMKGNQINKRFKVEKYGKLQFVVAELFIWHQKKPPYKPKLMCPSVLPKFKVSLDAPKEVSIGKEELELEVCAK